MVVLQWNNKEKLDILTILWSLIYNIIIQLGYKIILLPGNIMHFAKDSLHTM